VVSVPGGPGRDDARRVLASLDGLLLFAGEPQMAASRDYRRWAFESAALDLALRQAGLSFAGARARVPARAFRRLDARRRVRVAGAHPELELKLDPDNEWDRRSCSGSRRPGACASST
jgi:hypothetical protein